MRKILCNLPLPDPATPAYVAETKVTVDNDVSGVVAVPTGTTEHGRLTLWIAKTEAATFTGLTGWTQTLAEESVPGAMLYAYEKEAGFTSIGNALSLSTVTHPAICALSATKIAYIDGTNDQLRTYDFDGTDWVLTGTPLTISGSVENAICAMSSTRIARIDFGAQSLQAYDLSAGAWSAVGNGLAISGTGFPALCALSSTRIAFIDGVNDSLRAYDFDGTDWTLVGNAFAISGTGGPALAKLSSTRVAFIDGLHDELRAYDFNGTDWTLTGNALAISTISEPRLCALGAGRVIFVSNEDVMRCYDFDGTDWTQTGSDLPVSGVDYPALAALSATTFAFIDGLNDELRTYGFDLGSSYTPAWTGADDAVIYMVNVDQCGGSTFKGTDAPAEDVWAVSGTGLSIPGIGGPNLAALNTTDVAFIDRDVGDLSLYSWKAGTWALVGTALTISPIGSPAIAALNSTDVAFYDSNVGSRQLRLYRWNSGTETWSQVGTGLSSIVFTGATALAALNSTDVAFTNGTLEEIRLYRWSAGTETWSQVGAGLPITGMGNPVLTTLNSTDVAYFDIDLDELRLYRWNSGTETWSLVGTGLSIGAGLSPGLTSLNSTDVVFCYNGVTDEFRLYRWDDNTETWSEIGTGTEIGASIGIPSVAALGSRAFAFVDATLEELRYYIRGTDAPTCPPVTTGSANNFILRGMVCAGAPTVTEPAGTTAVGATASPNNELTLALAYEAVATAGTDIGAGAFALSAAQPWAAASVLLRAGDENPVPPVSAVTLSYEDAASDTVDRTVYTLAGMGLGEAAADRKIVACILSRATGASVSSVTIGGVAATLLTDDVLNTFNTMAFAIADVPTGTTGDVVVTFASGASCCGVATYRLVGAASTVADIATDIADPFTPTIDCPAGGVIIGMLSLNTADSSTMTELTKDATLSIEGNGAAFASASFAEEQTGLTVGFTQAATNSAASFISMGPA